MKKKRYGAISTNSHPLYTTQSRPGTRYVPDEAGLGVVVRDLGVLQVREGVSDLLGRVLAVADRHSQGPRGELRAPVLPGSTLDLGAERAPVWERGSKVNPRTEPLHTSDHTHTHTHTNTE